jgi:hypothetical protein
MTEDSTFKVKDTLFDTVETKIFDCDSSSVTLEASNVTNTVQNGKNVLKAKNCNVNMTQVVVNTAEIRDIDQIFYFYDGSLIHVSFRKYEKNWVV